VDLTIRVAGEAGQGVQTTGNLLVATLAEMGLHVFATQSYMSRIRGGLNWFDVRIGDRPLFSGREMADLLVALTPQALATLRPYMAQGGAVVFNGECEGACIGIGLEAVAKEVGGSAVMANAVAAGVVFTLLDYDAAPLTDYLRVRFKKKGAETVEKNVACAEEGARRAAARAGALRAPTPTGTPVTVASGTEAVGLAAATAGVKFAASYPMTPATGVFTYLASVADEYGIVVEQAEDEIAAVNMVCGATYVGVPAMTTTSGGGFALMVEGLSLAGMLELPILIMLSQRPGPATGLPTRTAQQDLLFAVHAGHGEFPRAIFAPGTPEQAHRLTRRALETAHKWQSPAILILDAFLADLVMDTPPLDTALRPIDRHILAEPPANYVRYAVTESGVSPRALPGSSAFVVVDSDEHTEDGHLTEDLEARVRLQDKRSRKAQGMRAEALAPERYGPQDAEALLVCWGSTYGPCREAVDILAAAGASVAMLHFAQVWPLDAAAVRKAMGLDSGAAGPKRVVSVEGNVGGQFAALLRQAVALADCECVCKYDGMPFTGEEIAGRLKA